MSSDERRMPLPVVGPPEGPGAVGARGVTAGRVFGGSGAVAERGAGSLYIHVPFCSHKCHYCDFYSFVDTRDQQGAFVERLIGELRVLAPHAARPLRTVFVGGGTPSLLRVELWDRLLAELGGLFDLSRIRGRESGETEFTVECNPETVTEELVARLRAGGVDRISMGAQSFEPRHLRTLERWHDPASVERALGLVRAGGVPRASIDLIFAIPGQTLAEWEADVGRALSLGLDHVSCYNLTYEPNTAMTKRLEMGEFEPAEDELEIAMYQHAVAALGGAGLARYEVSNFARPGEESRHNLAYWRNEEWLAAGPSASGHARGWRWKNVPRLPDYLASEGYSPVVDLEAPDGARALRERVMMGLRVAEGLDERAMLEEAGAIGPGVREALAREAGRLRAEGLLLAEGPRWRLTDGGFVGADRVASRLMAASWA